MAAPEPPAARRRVALPLGLLLASALLLVGAAPGGAQGARPEGRTLAEWQVVLAGEDPAARRQAAATLPAFGADAVPALTAALDDTDPEVRLEAVKSLGRLGPAAHAAVPALARAMTDRVPFVRRGVAATLGGMTPPTAVAIEALMKGLVDPDAAVIDNSAHALLALGPPVVPALVRALKDPDVGLRQMAVLTLSGGIRFGRLGPIGPEAVTALIDTLGDVNADIRDEAARTLADLGPSAKEALPALQRVAANDPAEHVRRVARRAIETIQR
jgi:HEAT repeat protein